MFIQNPYGRDANVSSALFGLSHSLREMFKDEMTQRQAAREHDARMQQAQIALKQLDLEGRKQQLQNRLSLSKLNLEGARDQRQADQWQQQFGLNQAYNEARIQDMQADNRLAREKFQAEAPVRALRQETARTQLDAARAANQPVVPYAQMGIDPKDAATIGPALGLPPAMLTNEMPAGQFQELWQNIQKNPATQAIHATYLMRKTLEGLGEKYDQAPNALAKEQVRRGVTRVLENLKRFQQNAGDPKAKERFVRQIAEADIKSNFTQPEKAVQRAGQAFDTMVAGSSDRFLSQVAKRFGLEQPAPGKTPPKTQTAEMPKPQQITFPGYEARTGGTAQAAEPTGETAPAKTETKTPPPVTPENLNQLRTLVNQLRQQGQEMDPGTLREEIKQKGAPAVITRLQSLLNNP